MAGKPIKDGEDDQIMNNRPPDLRNDYGIPDEEDRLDRELMPDAGTDTKAKK
ncbi:hypothetical protein [Paenibacillus sp.]|uniref:hypothetical protein n=1 Tax=Paenibacillus sp. TaxID=58172 RepID=UPI002D558089|nr:hypothetical protein [Paenibacillus sp.]HZG88209.1 hypothetical protein [Paenibacillus sp.]